MSWLRSAWGWLAALVMTLLAGVGLAGWWRERRARLRQRDRELADAREGLTRAQQRQQELLDQGVARSDEATARERAAAAEEVERESRDADLVDLYDELDAGAEADD